jgi:DNA polymerase III epsilon subunit-like protein
MEGPKIFTYDIENSPILADVWQAWDNNVSANQEWRSWFVMTWAGKWMHEDYIWGDSMFNYKPEYKADPENDYYILLSLRDMLDEADIVVGHNSNRFDTPKVLTRMLELGIEPPSPFKQVDTLKMVKRKYRFTRNSLTYVCDKLGIGEKVATGGHELWQACLRGEALAWKKMMMYNEHDVFLTEELYKLLSPYSGQKPNYGLYVEDDLPRCTNPTCGGVNVIRKGYDYTNVSVFRRWKCKDCGNPMRSRTREKPKKNLLVSVT